jgi:hypothetical protein
MKTKSQFDSLTLIENGIQLQFKNNNQHPISFSELDKIYIKKHQFGRTSLMGFLVLPIVLIPLVVSILPLDIVLFLVLITAILFYTKATQYKWYSLKVMLQDGTLFQKKVPVRNKFENIYLINKVKDEKYYYMHSGLIEGMNMPLESTIGK